MHIRFRDYGVTVPLESWCSLLEYIEKHSTCYRWGAPQTRVESTTQLIVCQLSLHASTREYRLRAEMHVLDEENITGEHREISCGRKMFLGDCPWSDNRSTLVMVWQGGILERVVSEIQNKGCPHPIRLVADTREDKLAQVGKDAIPVVYVTGVAKIPSSLPVRHIVFYDRRYEKQLIPTTISDVSPSSAADYFVQYLEAIAVSMFNDSSQNKIDDVRNHITRTCSTKDAALSDDECCVICLTELMMEHRVIKCGVCTAHYCESCLFGLWARSVVCDRRDPICASCRSPLEPDTMLSIGDGPFTGPKSTKIAMMLEDMGKASRDVITIRSGDVDAIACGEVYYGDLDEYQYAIMDHDCFKLAAKEPHFFAQGRWCKSIRKIIVLKLTSFT